MWTKFLVLALLGTFAVGSFTNCPTAATCRDPGSIEAKSFTFLSSLDSKQYRDITKLTITNASLDKVPPELKYFKELKYLDLSHNNIQISSIPPLLPKLRVLKLSDNNIKNLDFAKLPKNIEELDLSNNLLSHIPQDYSTLKSLSILNLTNNLFDCDCNNYNALTYKKLLKDGIILQEPITCQYPKQFLGKNINSINCTLNDIMVYDEADEGSGSGDDTFTDRIKIMAPHLQEDDNIDENEFVDDINEHPKDEFLNVTDDGQEEGSGDIEGSAFGPIDLVIPICHINCSSPEPIEGDSNDTIPMRDPTDQIKILSEDILNPIIMEPTTTTTTTTTTTKKPEVVTEEMIKKEHNHLETFKGSDKKQDVDIFSNETKTEKMEKATALNQNNSTVYVVVVCGLILAIVFLICFIKKRKAKRIKKNRKDKTTVAGDEMKPLDKTAITAVNEKNGKSLPENVPLINGQNGKHSDEPILKAYTPLEHPENPSEEPELREKLTPSSPRERVTIRASEIPESIPKTPVFVHRQKNSEGEIITTVLPP